MRVNGVSTWILTLCGALAIATSSCLAATGAGPAADSIVAGATASEAAPDPLQQAAESMAAGRPAEAYARLSALAASRAGDPEFDYLLGLAAIESRQAAAAIAPLRRVLAAEPRFDGARLELARALAATGALEAARREYQTVRDGGASAIARDAASRAMAAIGAGPRTSAWRVSPALVAGAGYDSNANASTSGDVFGFVLDPRAVQQSSPILEAGGSLGAQRELGRLGTLTTLLRGGHRAYPEAHFVDQSVLDAGVGLRHRFGAWNVGVGATFAGGWLDGAPWFQSAWLEGAISRPLGQRFEMVAAGRAIALDYQQSRFEPLDARRYVWGAALQTRERAGEVPRLGVGVIGGRDSTRDRGSPWSNDRYGARIFGSWPFDARRAAFAELAWLTSDYFGARGFNGVDRLDRQLVGALGFDARGWPSRGWRITPQVRWTDNRSNVTLFRFDRFEASVYLRREFD